MKKICPHCKKSFESTHARQKYCSDSHRVSAYYKRKGFKVLLIAPDDFKKENSELGIVKSEIIEEKKEEYKNSFLKQTGAAALGNLASQLILDIFKNDDDKPVTRKEMKILIQVLYNGIKNNQIIISKNIMKELLEIKKNI
jgi:hypothetical protein